MVIIIVIVLQSVKSNSLFDKPDLLKASEPSLSQNSFSDQGAGDFSDTARFNVSKRLHFIQL